VLIGGHADDAAQVPGLPGQAEGQIASVIADGAYDGEPTYAAAVARQHDPISERQRWEFLRLKMILDRH
jgi:hypothetical protein